MPSRTIGCWLAAAFVLLLALHLALAFRFSGPILYEDTMGYLAIARDIAGWRPQPTVNAPHGAYHFGYSLLLAPMYLVHDSSWRVFQSARVLDSLLASSQILLLYILGRGPFRLGRGFALGAALAASLYPPWLMQSAFVWTESLFALLFSSWVVLAWEALRRRSGPWLAAFGLTGVLLYAVHPRGLGLVVITLAALVIWTLRGRTDSRWTRWGIPTAVAVGLSVAGTRVLNARFLERLWVKPPRLSEGFLLGLLSDPTVWVGALPARIVGQLWYLQAATLGIFAVGAFVLVGQAWRGRASPETPERAQVAALILAGAAAVMFASVVVMLPAIRPDHLVYGRYNEALLGPLLMAGLAGLAGTRPASRLARLAGSAALLGLLGIVLLRILPAEVLAGEPMPLNVLGVLLWSPWGTFDFGRTTWIVLAALAAFAVAMLVSRRAALAVLAAYFAASAVLLEQKMLQWGRNVRGMVTLQEVIRPLAPASISYERGGLSTFGFNGYQFWLDRLPFHQFDAAAGETPRDQLVVAPKSWGSRAPGFRMVAAERIMDQALWVAPGHLQAELDRLGWMVPADQAAPLPPEACRSRLRRLDGRDGPLVIRAGSGGTLRLRLEHAGRGASWSPLGTTASPWGSVRVGAHWFRATETAAIDMLPLRAELPQMLRPGDSAEIEMALQAERTDGAPLEGGSYVLEVSLVQEGVQWFPAAGDSALRIPVEVR